MFIIDKQFDDDYKGGRKSSVQLSLSKPINPNDMTYPITWIGFVGGLKVEIIQLSASALSISDFVFKDYPEKYIYLKTSVVNWIHDYLRILN